MRRSFAAALLAVATLSAVLGFTLARYTSAPWRTAAAPTPSTVPEMWPASSAGSRPEALALPDFADIAERATSAVVGVTSVGASEGGRAPSDPFHFFFGPHGRRSRSSGSGFVITEDGYILTNYHVVEEGTKVQVDLPDRDRTRLVAKVVGQDPETDLALLKVEVEGKLPAIPLGDSDAVRPGEWVIAIGNPLFYDHTVTVGVVSAKGRRLESDSPFDSFIQTDAAINFGNSGGPLLNVRGEVIGINTAISSQGQNIGFAVPVNTAKEILPQLKERGRVVRGFMGVGIQELDANLAAAMKLDSRDGAVVTEVQEGEAGDKAGLEVGDVILSVDGKPIRDDHELVQSISVRAPGATVRLGIVREGDRRDLQVTLGERKSRVAEDRPEEGDDGGDEQVRLGISATELTPRVRAQWEIDEDVQGVLVLGVDEAGPAGDGSLARGDVILDVNREPVRSLAGLKRILAKAAPGEPILIYAMRGGSKFWVSVRAGEK